MEVGGGRKSTFLETIYDPYQALLVLDKGVGVGVGVGGGEFTFLETMYDPFQALRHRKSLHSWKPSSTHSRLWSCWRRGCVCVGGGGGAGGGTKSTFLETMYDQLQAMVVLLEKEGGGKSTFLETIYGLWSCWKRNGEKSTFLETIYDPFQVLGTAKK